MEEPEAPVALDITLEYGDANSRAAVPAWRACFITPPIKQAKVG